MLCLHTSYNLKAKATDNEDDCKSYNQSDISSTAEISMNQAILEMQSINEEYFDIDNIYGDLADFMMKLSRTSKQSIWHGSVISVNRKENRKEVLHFTTDRGHIERLVKGCIEVYVQVLCTIKANIIIVSELHMPWIYSLQCQPQL